MEQEIQGVAPSGPGLLPSVEPVPVSPADAASIPSASELLSLLARANGALNSAMAMVDAEWRNHDKACDRHDKIVREFRNDVRAALAKAAEQ